MVEVRKLYYLINVWAIKSSVKNIDTNRDWNLCQKSVSNQNKSVMIGDLILFFKKYDGYGCIGEKNSINIEDTFNFWMKSFFYFIISWHQLEIIP